MILAQTSPSSVTDMPYQLPTHPAILNNDPLGIIEADDVPQAQVLDTLLDAAVTRLTLQNAADTLTTLVEDVAYTIHGNGSINTENLRQFLRREESPAPQTIVSLLSAARNLSERFPTHSLEQLKEDGDITRYNGGQVDSLLAHQFLGSLPQPEGTSWGLPCFTDWFAGDPAHPEAVDGYLRTIFDHFAQGGYAPELYFTFSLHTADSMPDPSKCKTTPEIHFFTAREESEPSDDLEPTFVLVAAHSQPGPGATGTQEERLQSASQALSISALISPILADNAAVVTSMFPVHAAWKGHNRTTRLGTLYPTARRPQRHYILADALQLDDVEGEDSQLSDLQAKNMEREVKKLYAAFSGAVKMQEVCGKLGSPIIETGAWGCGAFGGNIYAKAICIMVAAGLTGAGVCLTLLESRKQEVVLVRSLLARQLNTAKLWNAATTARTIDELNGLLDD